MSVSSLFAHLCMSVMTTFLFALLMRCPCLPWLWGMLLRCLGGGRQSVLVWARVANDRHSCEGWVRVCDDDMFCVLAAVAAAENLLYKLPRRLAGAGNRASTRAGWRSSSTAFGSTFVGSLRGGGAGTTGVSSARVVLGEVRPVDPPKGGGDLSIVLPRAKE